MRSNTLFCFIQKHYCLIHWIRHILHYLRDLLGQFDRSVYDECPDFPAESLFQWLDKQVGKHVFGWEVSYFNPLLIHLIIYVDISKNQDTVCIDQLISYHSLLDE